LSYTRPLSPTSLLRTEDLPVFPFKNFYSTLPMPIA